MNLQGIPLGFESFDHNPLNNAIKSNKQIHRMTNSTWTFLAFETVNLRAYSLTDKIRFRFRFCITWWDRCDRFPMGDLVLHIQNKLFGIITRCWIYLTIQHSALNINISQRNLTNKGRRTTSATHPFQYEFSIVCDIFVNESKVECRWQEVAYNKFEETFKHTHTHTHRTTNQPQGKEEEEKSEENSNAMGKDKSKNFLLLYFLTFFLPVCVFSEKSKLNHFDTQQLQHATEWLKSRTKHGQWAMGNTAIVKNVLHEIIYTLVWSLFVGFIHKFVCRFCSILTLRCAAWN